MLAAHSLGYLTTGISASLPLCCQEHRKACPCSCVIGQVEDGQTDMMLAQGGSIYSQGEDI